MKPRSGGWHGELSLAQTAHRLIDAASVPPPTGPAGGMIDDVDPGPYLIDLRAPGGLVSVIRPPGSPAWTSGAALPPPTRPVRQAR